MSGRPPIRRLAVHDWGTHPCAPDRFRDRLTSLDCDVVVREADDLDDCDAVVTLFHQDEFLESVSWVHDIRAGYEDFPLEAYRERGVAVTNSTGVAGDLVGETALGLMLSLSKGLHRFRDRQAEARWERLPVERPFELGRSSVCVVGLGQLGGSVASRAGVLGTDVVGVDVRPVSGLGLRRVYDVTDLSEAVADRRFVVLTTPLTPETRGLIDEDVLAAMREDAYLVNVSRGEVVDEDALVTALEADEIAGAALDVFVDEPLAPDSPLWAHPEVIVTPHAAAQADGYGRKLAELVRTNVARLDAGRPLWNEVVAAREPAVDGEQ